MSIGFVLAFSLFNRLWLYYADFDSSLLQRYECMLRDAAVGNNLVNVVYSADTAEASTPKF